MLFLTYTPQVC